jgi:hypothetical protein
VLALETVFWLRLRRFVGQPILAAAGFQPALEFLHFGTDFLTVPPRVNQAEAHALYQGMASAVPLEAVNSGL